MIKKNLTTETKHVEKKVRQWQNELRLLVPVDFSQNSHQALQYAMHLAKLCNGTIDLFHGIADEVVPASESPLTMKYALGKVEAEAHNKLSSLREIINDFGVLVSSSYVALGDPVASLKARLLQISSSSSHLVVLSQAEVSRDWAALKLPCLYVPSMLLPKTPNKVLMIRDGRPIHENALQPLLSIICSGKNQITVVDCSGGLSKMLFRYWLPLANTQVDFTHKYELINSSDGELSKVINKYKPDLICKVQRPQTWWERFLETFTRRFKTDFEIPTLIIPA
jgi:hypothetical protein